MVNQGTGKPIEKTPRKHPLPKKLERTWERGKIVFSLVFPRVLWA
jgi:hypothetical protein